MKVQKEINLFYYIEAYLRSFKGERIKNLLLEFEKLPAQKQQYLQERINYYNKISSPIDCEFEFTIADIRYPKKPSVYFIDSYHILRHFNKDLKLNLEPGDVIHIPNKPSFVKTRPINGENQNSIILKLERIRHFRRVLNDIDFNKKQNILFGRMGVYQEHRIQFLKNCFAMPNVDIGQVNTQQGRPDLYLKPKATIQEHLNYKYILSLQGNDVATNLKWIMSSNSIAVMPKPTIESWFMEGTLQDGIHYIEIKEDGSDLQEKIEYYNSKPKECEAILKNAHDYISPFYNKKQEELLMYMVAYKYFKLTNQL